ncbi:Cell surface glycoprotein MUC18 [Varanus komodoensis]|uniref:Ig-like domain-containing protein n=1 Tax=Varanus komodoensis TaxID=61221 RepID=A0A8D2J0P5_VARKO|nr:cell surface glycoprotein MUC18-like [Varanus komodoensis]KAF7242527.1 Cell surface glycoprotein MUC18 [Varanus komodoensis]
MAQFPGRLWLLALGLAVTLRLSRAGLPVIRLNDQAGPILEGSNVTLECLSDEGGEDLSEFTFQKFSKWLHSWISLDKGSRLHCWFYDVTVSRDNGRLLLAINDVQYWHSGPYRCASSNATSNASVSDVLDLKMEYLRGVHISRANSWCGTMEKTIRVQEGQDVKLLCSADSSQTPLFEWTREGDDWILPSNTLNLSKVNREQAGTYTCRAQHPTLAQLVKSKSVLLLVDGPERSFSLESLMSLSTPMLALSVALPAVLLLLLIMVLAVLVPRRRAAAAKKKAAQQEAGQRTPIYKGSLESVPSVVGDTHPLVM